MKRIFLIATLLLPLFATAQNAQEPKERRHEIGISPLKFELGNTVNLWGMGPLGLGPELRYRYHIGNLALRANASWNWSYGELDWVLANVRVNSVTNHYRFNLGVQYGFQYEWLLVYAYTDIGFRYLNIRQDNLTQNGDFQTERTMIGFGWNPGLGIDFRLTNRLHLSLELSGEISYGPGEGIQLDWEDNEAVGTTPITTPNHLYTSFFSLSAVALSYRF